MQKFEAAVNFVAFGFQRNARIGNGEFLLFEKMLYPADFIDAFLVVATRATLAFVRTDIVELFCPLTQSGLRNAQQFGHFFDGVKLFHA
jgi:hypothetical protein